MCITILNKEAFFLNLGHSWRYIYQELLNTSLKPVLAKLECIETHVHIEPL